MAEEQSGLAALLSGAKDVIVATLETAESIVTNEQVLTVAAAEEVLRQQEALVLAVHELRERAVLNG